MNLIKIFTLLFLTLNAYAETGHMLIIGGGGEPNKETTIFDMNLEKVASFQEKSGYKTTISFNGGHVDTEKIVNSNFKGEVSNRGAFTGENYDQIISETIKKLENGQIPANDKILLYINTHGAEKESNELTHKISVTGGNVQNFNTLAGSKTVSLDRLKELADLAERKNVKLGILDMSCHSGSSMALANSKTCVISAAGPNHYGIIGRKALVV